VINLPLLNLMHMSGAFDLVRIGYSHQAMIVAYHRFSTLDNEHRSPARIISEQLEYLTSHYRIAPLGQLVEQLQIRASCPPLFSLEVNLPAGIPGSGPTNRVIFVPLPDGKRPRSRSEPMSCGSKWVRNNPVEI
jgi:hypothetical protein